MKKSCYARVFYEEHVHEIEIMLWKFIWNTKNIMLWEIMLWKDHVRQGLAVPMYVETIPDLIALIKFQSKLVYEGHIYDGTPIISDLPYPEFDEGLTWMQRFVEIVGQNCTAPFWMGEFGTGSNSVNWQKMIRFIREHDLDWAIWPIDGYQ